MVLGVHHSNDAGSRTIVKLEAANQPQPRFAHTMVVVGEIDSSIVSALQPSRHPHPTAE